MKATNGRSTSGTTGLGTVEVSGRSRVPSPPTRITACTRAPSRRPPYAPVGQPGGGDRGRVQRVAPVDEQLPAHLPRHRAEVELLELVPLGHEDHGVGAVHRAQRVV